MTPRIAGLADTSISSGALLVQGSTRGEQAYVENFSDDNYMVQVDVAMNSGTEADILVRRVDENNAYVIRLTSSGWVYGYARENGKNGFSFSSSQYTTGASVAVKIKVSGTSIKAWVDGSLEVSVTSSTFAVGGVGFGGDQPKFDNLMVGYDNNSVSAQQDHS